MAAAAPVEEKKETTAPIKPTSHLFHISCQEGAEMLLSYCGLRIGRAGSGPWNGLAKYETCVVCLEIRAVACPVCGAKL